jgi:energy-converting hydrogenase Eha subunit G
LYEVNEGGGVLVDLIEFIFDLGFNAVVIGFLLGLFCLVDLSQQANEYSCMFK